MFIRDTVLFGNQIAFIICANGGADHEAEMSSQSEANLLAFRWWLTS
jgi:hypothetical protein